MAMMTIMMFVTMHSDYSQGKRNNLRHQMELALVYDILSNRPISSSAIAMDEVKSGDSICMNDFVTLALDPLSFDFGTLP
ncbi:MAG: hypothetical protein WD356_10560 [Pseudomonadales bacterium]